MAFYDALADNESAREVIQDQTLKLIARELSERIKAKASLDWTQVGEGHWLTSSQWHPCGRICGGRCGGCCR